MTLSNTVALGIAALSIAAAMTPAACSAADIGVKNIVLVHRAWADGSGWQGIYNILARDGYDVSLVANPLTSLADDVTAVDRVLAR